MLCCHSLAESAEELGDEKDDKDSDEEEEEEPRSVEIAGTAEEPQHQ